MAAYIVFMRDRMRDREEFGKYMERCRRRSKATPSGRSPSMARSRRSKARRSRAR